MEPPDRRKRRSPETLKAIHFQLQTVAENLDAVAVFVADEDGLLLGGSETDIDKEALAAYSSMPFRLSHSPGQMMNMAALMKEFDGYHVHLQRFSVDGQPFQLGVVTERAPEEVSGAESSRAITGVIRILAEPVQG